MGGSLEQLHFENLVSDGKIQGTRWLLLSCSCFTITFGSDRNRRPKRRFLLGLGEPFEPNPWDISDSEDDEKYFLMASQMAEKELTQSKLQPSDRWGSPKSSAKLDLLRKDGIQRALRSKRTGLSLCGLSGRAIAPRILSRLMNVCTSSNKNLQP